jgi:hypothetical protein
MVALNIFSIFVDSPLPAFNQIMYSRPVQVALLVVLPLAKAVLHCLVCGVILSSQKLKHLRDGLCSVHTMCDNVLSLGHNIPDIFPAG